MVPRDVGFVMHEAVAAYRFHYMKLNSRLQRILTRMHFYDHKKHYSCGYLSFPLLYIFEKKKSKPIISIGHRQLKAIA